MGGGWGKEETTAGISIPFGGQLALGSVL